MDVIKQYVFACVDVSCTCKPIDKILILSKLKYLFYLGKEK